MIIRSEICNEIEWKCFRSYWGGLGAGSNFMCVQCLLRAVWSRREKELVKCFLLTSAHSSAYEHWKAKQPDWGGNCPPCHWCKRQLDAGDTHPTGDNAKQHLQSREQLSSGWRKGCSPLGFQHPQSSRRLLRQSGSYPWIHQATHMPSVLSESPDCLVQSEPRLPVPSPACPQPSHMPLEGEMCSMRPLLPAALADFHKANDDKTVSSCTHHFLFSSHHKEDFSHHLFCSTPALPTSFWLSSSAWWFLSRFLAVFSSQNKNIIISSSKALCLMPAGLTELTQGKKEGIISITILFWGRGSNSPWNILL